MSQWKSFLTEQESIVWSGQEAIDYAGLPQPVNKPATDSHLTYLIPLTHLTLSVIEGPDTKTFLQGQVTCDIQNLSPDRALRGCHCTHQGKIISDFLAIEQTNESTEQRILLRTHHSTQSLLMSSLKKYMIFSKAESSINSGFIGVGLIGKDTVNLVKAAFGIEQWQSLAVYHPHEKAMVVALNDCAAEVWVTEDIAEVIWNTLKGAGALPGVTSQWQRFFIQQGHAQVEEETSGLFTPEVLNFDLIEAVSFTKGCYTGQEVVARMNYKGKQKKRLFRFILSEYPAALASPANHIPVNTPVFATEDQHNKNVGVVINSASLPDGSIDLLASIHSDSVHKMNQPTHDVQFSLQDLPNTPLTLGSLPYTINNV
ncbi:YgfZ/GcvT domain-containing protein [Marinibactrum halimedae]|uniref:tRNA-modifying protein YgfZ n=1 Tax=Marinibactrum halimedae TaxID=1444977 RepID=A0AA37WMY2_9GAMM|nr:hypothetical protein [Marinibactrum halimedae]MCD9459659.1 hypothetical protein [Marinibactrum halimedae]GLS25686.1 tRNA-modifying protein YgfZ [Marinibactrum halimedae]